MKSAAQSEITKYITTFLAENCSEEVLENWNEEENMKAFEVILTKETKKTSGKKTKDPNAPKRGKSAYILFCNKKREEARAAVGDDAKQTEVMKKLGEMWQALKDYRHERDKNALKALEEEALADKARYEEEMKEYTPPSDEELSSSAKKSPKTKDPNAPKRGKTAYVLFCAAKRQEAKETLGDDAKGKDVMSHFLASCSHFTNHMCH
jgi:hypothetical protein